MDAKTSSEWFSIDVLYRAVSSSLQAAQEQMGSGGVTPMFMIADCRIEVPVLMRQSERGLELCTLGSGDIDPLHEGARTHPEGGLIGRVSLTLRPGIRG